MCGLYSWSTTLTKINHIPWQATYMTNMRVYNKFPGDWWISVFLDRPYNWWQDIQMQCHLRHQQMQRWMLTWCILSLSLMVRITYRWSIDTSQSLQDGKWWWTRGQIVCRTGRWEWNAEEGDREVLRDAEQMWWQGMALEKKVKRWKLITDKHKEYVNDMCEKSRGSGGAWTLARAALQVCQEGESACGICREPTWGWEDRRWSWRSEKWNA